MGDLRRIEGETLQVYMMGGFYIQDRGRRILLPWKRNGRDMQLLAFLLYYGPEGVYREEVIRCLFPGEETRVCGGKLRVAVHRLRERLRELGLTERIESAGKIYRWGAPVWLDVRAFEEAAQAALRSGGEGELKAAMGLYRSGFLKKAVENSWAREKERELAGLFMDCAGRLEKGRAKAGDGACGPVLTDRGRLWERTPVLVSWKGDGEQAAGVFEHVLEKGEFYVPWRAGIWLLLLWERGAGERIRTLERICCQQDGGGIILQSMEYGK